ncbi:MAG: thioredoxin family protein [Anaerolineae bacterium]|nr:thioredoxin family protein [Anaerolineae bacterium]
MGEQAEKWWQVFWKENWSVIVVVAALAAAYLFLRTPGDAVASLSDLESQLQSGAPTVVEFYSNSCSICLISKPKVDRLEANLAGEATVLRLNVKDAVGGTLAARWGVRGVPTFFVVDGTGQIVYAQAGAPDVAALEAAVSAAR